MQFDETSRKRKTNPKSSTGTLVCRVDLREQLEHPLQHILRNANSRIRYAYDDFVSLAAQLQDDTPSAGSVPAGVLQQI